MPARRTLAAIASLSVFIFSSFAGSAARAQKNDFAAEAASKNGPKLGLPHVERWRIGVNLVAQGGLCLDVVGSVPLPVEWPEQKVTIVKEDFSVFSRNVQYRMVDTVKELAFTMPQVPFGQTSDVLVTVEITRFPQAAPDNTSILKQIEVRKLPRDMRHYLGPSPRIESKSGKIKSLANKLMKEAEEKNDWNKVQTIFDWVRDNVKHEDGAKQPGALQALKDESSDHEGLTSLFVALCRAAGYPARTVWVPKSSYPEFYLVDDEEEGHWYPCRLAEPATFGANVETLPIWQKGDNFRSPGNRRETYRYIPGLLSAKNGEPKVSFVRQLINGAE